MWELDPESLILEVESRPILYVKPLPEYANKSLKNDAWEEVAQALSCDWESLSPAEENKRCKEVQSKWKHIRDNFRREYQAQNNITSGHQGAKKRKRYRYYDQLLFLIPYVKDAPTPGKYKVQIDNDNTEQIVLKGETEKTKAIPRVDKNIKKEKSTFEYEIFKMMKEEMATVDEDRTFCISLVPSLKKMDDDKKIAAKIDILKIIQQYSG
ncbi:uncharacterized protein LOC134796600 [Cydia splendana]|uniref:uncharacterized protein LOC134796600 n=1 Tax=Cydia splendana TaxID=1100963 RepID=UPI0021455562